MKKEKFKFMYSYSIYLYKLRNYDNYLTIKEHLRALYQCKQQINKFIKLSILLTIRAYFLNWAIYILILEAHWQLK